VSPLLIPSLGVSPLSVPIDLVAGSDRPHASVCSIRLADLPPLPPIGDAADESLLTYIRGFVFAK
jgi:hypothetical protein